MALMKSWVVLVCVVALAGCGEKTGENPGSEPTMTASESPPGDPSETSHPPVVAEAVADLAQREGVDPGEVALVSQEEVTWRNGSRGCAKPGMAYTQALIDGSRIVLRLDGTDYEYHSGGSRPPFWCEKPTE